MSYFEWNNILSKPFYIWMILESKGKPYAAYVYLILYSLHSGTPHIYHPDYAWMLGICNKLDVIASCTFFISFKSFFYVLVASVVSIIHLAHKILYLIHFINFTFLCPNPSTITSLTTISSSRPSLFLILLWQDYLLQSFFPRDISFSWAAKLQQV